MYIIKLIIVDSTKTLQWQIVPEQTHYKQALKAAYKQALKAVYKQALKT